MFYLVFWFDGLRKGSVFIETYLLFLAPLVLESDLSRRLQFAQYDDNFSCVGLAINGHRPSQMSVVNV